MRTIGGGDSYLGGGVFAHNSMTSLTLGSSVERIYGQAFIGNRLTQVSIPLSLEYLSNDYFAYWSMSREEVRLLEQHSYTGHDLPSDEILTSMQYVGLVTPDGANPNDLSHGVQGVCLEYDETTWECNNTMNVGGHLINPAQLTVNYHNDVGSALLPSDTFTGQLGDDSYTTDYRVSRVAIPFPDISDYLTQEQQDANNSALNSVFFMRSSSVEIAPPSIGGYITPPVQTFSLLNFSNQGTYVYNTLVGNDDEEGANADDDGDTTELADTGFSSTIILVASLLTVFTGCALLTLGLRRRKQL